jgi:hypothetical protein
VPRQIVLPLDGTPLAEQIIRHAVNWANGGRRVHPAPCRRSDNAECLSPRWSKPDADDAQVLDEIQRCRRPSARRPRRTWRGVAAGREQSLRVQTRVAVDEQPAQGDPQGGCGVGAD